MGRGTLLQEVGFWEYKKTKEERIDIHHTCKDMD